MIAKRITYLTQVGHFGLFGLELCLRAKSLPTVGVAKAVAKRANKTAENFIVLNKIKKLKVGNVQEVRVLKVCKIK